MSDQTSFAYRAMDARGRQVRGVVAAATASLAFDDLKRKGLSPIRIEPARVGARPSSAGGLSRRQTADLLFELSALLDAGADIKSALSICASKVRDAGVVAAIRQISQRVSGGDKLSEAVRSALGEAGRFPAALIAAGEARGDIGAGLRQGSELLRSEMLMRSKLVEALSYPAFILISSLGALVVILVYVIPSLEPILQLQQDLPLFMSTLLVLSHFLRDWGAALAIGVASALAASLALSRLGLLSGWTDRLMLDGPAKPLVRSFVYGRFAQVLGRLQVAGVPLAESLRLSGETLGSELARSRLAEAAHEVRQGNSISSALERVSGFPEPIVRLCTIGERTGDLGPMLDRAGTLELEGLTRRIDALAKVLGPAMIIILGVVIGLMMGGLLSGVSNLGAGV